jgi:hypothetical protein
MQPYAVFMRVEAVSALHSLPRPQQQAIARFVDRLAEDPFQQGDYTDRDMTNRELQIKIVGLQAVTFWGDHPVREVKITDIRRADIA